ncbi:hypothetical protein D3C76_1492730 [compost metagenome]
MVAQGLFAGSAELTQTGKQFIVGFFDGIFADIAQGRPGGRRCEQGQWCSQAPGAQGMGQLERQQAAQAVTEQGIRPVQFGFDLVGQLEGQLLQVTLQGLTHAHAAPGQFQWAQL